MDSKTTYFVRAIGIYLIAIALYWFIGLGLSLPHPDIPNIIMDLMGLLLIGLFISGIILLTAKKWSWYPAVIFIALCIGVMTYGIIEASWDVWNKFRMSIISFPLINSVSRSNEKGSKL